LYLNEFIDKCLVEEIVKKLKTSFKEIKEYLPSGWRDYTTGIKPFGNKWGRGLLDDKGYVIIAYSGTKHSILKQRTPNNTELTFYWGYLSSNQTLYIELASVRGSGFNRQNVPKIVSAIIDRTKYNWKVDKKNIIFEHSIT
jgi:hypothetical protein